MRDWSDHRIGAGAEWQSTIDSHLEQAAVILFMVSADFLASDYVYGKEMERALERATSGQAIVIPILLRPVDWRSSPLGKFKALPHGGRAIALWVDRDEAWMDVARGVREVAERVRSAS